VANTPAEPAFAPERRVFTVSDLNRAAKAILEGGLPLLWVEGEISNLSRPASGHLYFSLKDAQAQVRCALFRNRGQLLRFKPADGMHVLLRARVSLYEARGDFQLIVEHMEEAGHGALQRAFEELKRKLAAEGLFAAEHKRPLPAVPRVIGVITSPSGAALRDILSVIRRRHPAARVVLYPVPVQGEGAGDKIAAMIDTASKRRECDVLILARGGGSLEDLWAFNEESVARAVYNCAVPVVSGVGHEEDFSIADFVADLRAPTPSGAAELVTPDSYAWMRALTQHGMRLHQGLARQLQAAAERLQWCTQRLRQLHPGRALQERMQRLDELDMRLKRGLRNLVAGRRAQLATLTAGVRQHDPRQRLQLLSSRLSELGRRLRVGANNNLLTRNGRLALAIRALHAVSPLATLNRGYAIVSDAGSGRLLTSVAQVHTGQSIRAGLADGSLLATVQHIDPDGKK
jgi:exodeoxyribonuclease VII large subunit